MRIARRARNRCRIPDSRRAGSRPWTSPRSAGAGTRRGRHAPASVRQPAPNKQRHNRHIREIKPDMKTSTQTDEKARHRNQKQRRQNQEPTQPATRYDAIRKPKKKHIPMQSPKEMDFLHPPASRRPPIGRNGNVFDGVCRPDVRYRVRRYRRDGRRGPGGGRHERWEYDPGAAACPVCGLAVEERDPRRGKPLSIHRAWPEPAPGGAEEGTGTRTPHVAGSRS